MAITCMKRWQSSKCGSVYAVAAENAELWIGAPCQRTTCGGFLEEYESGEINYYGRLYSAGDLVRINAREHTGLLERPDREQLEIDFKRSKDTQEIWDPNVLSCTPTLEMGIDIERTVWRTEEPHWNYRHGQIRTRWNRHLPDNTDYCPSLPLPSAQVCQQIYTVKKSG